MKRIFLFSCLLFIGLKASSQVVIDTFLTDYSRFIAAKPCFSNAFIELQKATTYIKHQNSSNKIWNHIQDSTLSKITLFNDGKKIIDSIDTNTCFYPFGGPDFLYANVFYPNAENYVLMGLEKLGTVPDLKKKTATEIDLLLEHINQSMQYLNKSGYFVTSHMSRDFSKSMMNGTIHTVLYFAANRNYLIKKLANGYISSGGKFTSYKTKNESQYYKAYDLTVTDTLGNEKHIYYISADIADYKIKTFPYFVSFVKGFGKTSCFIKSASYIPAHKNFSIVRNLILDNSVKIIQDDTGIPYKTLNDKTKWDYQFWGLYTSTIKDLSWGLQPDLKEAIKGHPNNQKLPFRISYNGNYGEGIIMVARKKN
jgi:hypothetical protein